MKDDSNKIYHNVCFVENLYTLLIYLLLAGEDAQNNTFFFFTSAVPDKIINKISHGHQYNCPKTEIGKVLFCIWLRIIKHWKYPWLKSASVYGQDNLLFTSPLLGKNKMTLIEDGVINYTLSATRTNGWFKKLIGGAMMAEPPFGISNFVEKIYLTGLGTIPDPIKHKVELVNLQNLWNQCSFTHRQNILSVYSLTPNLIEEFKQIDSVLFTQPLSEDHAIDEETKIQLYKNILSIEKMAIKPHPREKTNYSNYFPDVKILEPGVPIEILSLVGIRFRKSYTIFSTAVLSFPYSTEIHFLGTAIHPLLVKHFGDVRYNDGKIVRIDY